MGDLVESDRADEYGSDESVGRLVEGSAPRNFVKASHAGRRGKPVHDVKEHRVPSAHRWRRAPSAGRKPVAWALRTMRPRGLPSATAPP